MFIGLIFRTAVQHSIVFGPKICHICRSRAASHGLGRHPPSGTVVARLFLFPAIAHVSCGDRMRDPCPGALRRGKTNGTSQTNGHQHKGFLTYSICWCK